MSRHPRFPKRGSILVFFMLAVPLVLIPLVGLAIDATMCRIVQARLSAAVDGAALGTGRLLGTSADPVSIATEFVKANFLTDGTPGFWRANNLQISPVYTPGITKTIAINATVDVPLLFARVFGQPKATVSAAGTATRTDSRIMLVIDRSGSMHRTKLSDGNYPITDAINDAVEFTKSFTAGTDEVGLVVFDGSAAIGYPSYTPGSYVITPSASGGPDTGFSTPMVTALQAVQSNNGSTNTSEALWLAYVELQKAHLRDVAHGVDTRLNAIVLFTDGLPQSVTIYPNNTYGYPANYFLTTTSSCTNKYNAVTNPNPTAIVGYVTVPANSGAANANTFVGSSIIPGGLYQLAATDPASTHTSSWWMGSGAGYSGNLNPNTAAGCTGIASGTMGASTGQDLTKIPDVDAYGNQMSGTAYQNSVFIDPNGNTLTRANNPIYSGTNMNQSHVTTGKDWAMAMWNATDSAAQRIRSDVNQVNRSGDSKMPIYIYAIGFLGDGGVDQGLLARVANDKVLSNAYDSSTPAGKYYAASDSQAMHNAFESVAASLLRLAR